MTQSRPNTLISLFSSVQLAIFLLFLLASTSIIGTLIPQQADAQLYIDKYGPKGALFLQLLDIPTMYSSWWFLGLLGLFALNLIVCSLERIPRLIRLLQRDHLALELTQMEKMAGLTRLELTGSVEANCAQLRNLTQGSGWKWRERKRPEGTLLFAERGAWSRFGVYIVHLSILIILAGAVIGSPALARKLLRQPNFAFKGFVSLPESASINQITANGSQERIDLGFTLRCDAFHIAFYPNGMPKTYRSTVTILDTDKAPRTVDIEVNKPLSYRGITFYQSSYQPYQDYQISLKRRSDGLSANHLIAPARQQQWPEARVSYGIINRERQGEVTRKLKIWFSDDVAEPATFWVDMGEEHVITRPSGEYLFNAKQVYATGLQVAKDPGVWLVYTGCLLMLAGLFIAFFLSHQRLYAFLIPDDGATRLLFAGAANKNKLGFEREFEKIIKKIKS